MEIGKSPLGDFFSDTDEYGSLTLIDIEARDKLWISTDGGQ